MNNKKIKSIIILFIIFLTAILISCSKKDNDKVSESRNSNDTMKQGKVISSDDYAETDEDLFKVDYKEFYDELAPSGEWIEVTGKDLGLDVQNGTAQGEKGNRKISIAKFFGIEDAYASDLSVGAFFVWQPAPGLAVGLTAGDVAVQTTSYVPYSNGQWINTDAGWYFRANTPAEEITSHYGRWAYSPALGWVWLPGRVYSPAWVDWREDGDYIAWAPIPPTVYIVNNVISPPVIVEDRYIIVEKRYFVEPEVYKYMYKEDKNKIMIKEWRRIDGVMVMDKTVINRGPDVKVIEKFRGSPIESVKITNVDKRSDVKFTSKEINVYRQNFRKYDVSVVKEKGDNFKPGKFKTYNDVEKKNYGQEKKNESPLDKDKGTGNDKKLEKGYDKGKDNDNGNKKREVDPKKTGDDRDMHKEKNNNGNKNNDSKGNEKQKGNEGKHEYKDNGNKGNEGKHENKDNGNKGNDGDKGNHGKGKK